MEEFSKWIINWTFIMIPGIIYLLFMILIIQYNAKFNLYNFIKVHLNYLPYIFILSILFSYIIGLSAHYSLEQIIHPLNLNKGSDQKTSMYYQYYIDLSYYYQNLVMWRHLLISIFFLFLTLLLPKYRNFLKWPVWIVFIIVMCVIILSYLHSRELLINLDCSNQVYKIQQELNYHK
jgi:hypothetical protein